VSVVAPARLVRLGFAGVGWIGMSRMRALAESGLAEVAAIADPSSSLRAAAAEQAPSARPLESFGDLLDPELALDGVVIATPSALHAPQAIAALERGLAVFCQKPLARDADETAAVVEAARRADRLLGVDLSYRHTDAAQRMRELVRSGALGDVYAAEATFHNAYGPDKPWFKDRALSGGGCLIDLGTHLIDLVLWLLDARAATVRSAVTLRGGRPVRDDTAEVEDYAHAELALDTGVVARLACSWWLPVGRGCVIEVVLYGTDGAVALRNVEGSFYDFRCELMRGTVREPQTEPPDDWGGRAALEWAGALSSGRRYDSTADELVGLARVLDGIYEAVR
jgi:predicted dehydrogenase